MNHEKRAAQPALSDEGETAQKTDRLDVVEGPVGSASIKPLEEARGADIDPEALPAIDVTDTEARPR